MTVLDRVDSKDLKVKSIRDEAEYAEINRIFGSMGLDEKPHFMQFFARTDETIRPTYELIRLGKMAQSQTVLAKAVNSLFTTENDETGQSREQAIDGKNLPEFDKVRNYFGPAGIYGISEDNGYFFKGFLLEKQMEGVEKIEKADEPKDGDVEPAAEETVVVGVVMQDGQPVEGAKVEFKPIEETVVIEVETKKDGTYELKKEEDE